MTSGLTEGLTLYIQKSKFIFSLCPESGREGLKCIVYSEFQNFRMRPNSLNSLECISDILHSSVASSARSPCANSTGVVCVWKPVIDFGLPACPTTSTA